MESQKKDFIRNLLIVGNGKMGKQIYELDAKEHRKISVDPVNGDYKSLADFYQMCDPDCEKFIAIDFSTPSVVMKNIKWYAFHGMNAVVGTTGWASDPEKLGQVRTMVDDRNIGLVYSSNFSSSVQMIFVANRFIAAMADMLGGWDVAINEVHHNQKKDVSGTAKILAADIIKNGKLGKTGIADSVNGGKPDDKITISSDRLNGVFGEHTVSYANADGDRIELFHHANNRLGFATGALKAAEFIKGNKGLYDYSEVLRDNFIKAMQRELV